MSIICTIPRAALDEFINYEEHSRMPNLNSLVINEVRAEMARKRITAVEIAERSGESIFRVRRLLDGRQNVAIADLDMICYALEVDIADLILAARPRQAQA